MLSCYRFYREITEDCWPCTKCCPDSTPDELEPQCLSQGLPTKQSCRLDVKTEACAHAPTPKNVYIDINATNHRNSSKSGDSRVGVNHNATIIVQYNIITKSDHSIWAFVGTGTLFCLLVGVTVYTITHCRYCRKRSCEYIFTAVHG
jgi:hypothetical protein